MTYDNLTIAGDWTDSGFHSGCVEGAVMSGRLAAPSYTARIAGLGYSAKEIAEVSDRLVDALVAQGALDVYWCISFLPPLPIFLLSHFVD